MLKLQYLGKELTHLKRPLFWERLKAGVKGTTEDEMVGWLDGITSSMDMCLSNVQELVMDREAWHSACCSPWECKELDMTEQLN